ncbi:MAG: hypothetical protein ABR97_14300 [Rhodobacter sp. BACL10 MAG-120419-bin15]|nr:MAG: hypothetical protein ABR97_14300 [Rhodobacter sp. BACL10 MAG-120419-bin15]
MRPEALTHALGRKAGASSDFDLNGQIFTPSERILRPAAVLVTVWEKPQEAVIILTKRAQALVHHPGQIAFPGGKVDAQDCSVTDAALREADEEIGLRADRVTVIGALAPHETVTGFLVTPILAHINADFIPNLQRSEVAEVFTVPLAHLANLTNYRIEKRFFGGEWRSFYVVPYGPFYIWGATARILRGLAVMLQT